MIIDRRYQEATKQNIIERKKSWKSVWRIEGRIYVRSYFFKSCHTFELKMSGPLAYWKVADHGTGMENLFDSSTQNATPLTNGHPK